MSSNDSVNLGKVLRDQVRDIRISGEIIDGRVVIKLRAYIYVRAISFINYASTFASTFASFVFARVLRVARLRDCVIFSR